MIVESTSINVGLMPSYRDKCPRKGCNHLLEPIPREHTVLWRCLCGYEAIEVTGESKLAWAEAIKAHIRVRR